MVFPETFIPGYPIWMWRLRPGSDMSLTNELYGRLFANAVDLEGDDLAPLQAAAQKHSITVVCGMNERDGSVSRGTLYNTAVVIGADIGTTSTTALGGCFIDNIHTRAEFLNP